VHKIHALAHLFALAKEQAVTFCKGGVFIEFANFAFSMEMARADIDPSSQFINDRLEIGIGQGASGDDDTVAVELVDLCCT
jgi:hypothetical protein